MQLFKLILCSVLLLCGTYQLQAEESANKAIVAELKAFADAYPGNGIKLILADYEAEAYLHSPNGGLFGGKPFRGKIKSEGQFQAPPEGEAIIVKDELFEKQGDQQGLFYDLASGPEVYEIFGAFPGKYTLMAWESYTWKKKETKSKTTYIGTKLEAAKKKSKTSYGNPKTEYYYELVVKKGLMDSSTKKISYDGKLSTIRKTKYKWDNKDGRQVLEGIRASIASAGHESAKYYIDVKEFAEHNGVLLPAAIKIKKNTKKPQAVSQWAELKFSNFKINEKAKLNFDEM